MNRFKKAMRFAALILSLTAFFTVPSLADSGPNPQLIVDCPDAERPGGTLLFGFAGGGRPRPGVSGFLSGLELSGERTRRAGPGAAASAERLRSERMVRLRRPGKSGTAHLWSTDGRWQPSHFRLCGRAGYLSGDYRYQRRRKLGFRTPDAPCASMLRPIRLGRKKRSQHRLSGWATFCNFCPPVFPRL